MSDVYQSLAHSKWHFKYHVCSFPNGDGKRSSGISAVNWDDFHALAKQKNARSWRGTLMPDHVHM